MQVSSHRNLEPSIMLFFFNLLWCISNPIIWLIKVLLISFAQMVVVAAVLF